MVDLCSFDTEPWWARASTGASVATPPVVPEPPDESTAEAEEGEPEAAEVVA